MRLVHKYLLISGAVTAAFTNFIACGAQTYKASLHEDHEPLSETALNEDPNSESFGLHASKGWVKLPIVYRIDKGMSKVQLGALQGAMKTWEAATGKTLFAFSGVHSGFTGDSFPDLYSSLRDQINGQYFDGNWKKTGKSNQVLATTIWNNPNNNLQNIDAADIRYNSELYFISDALTQSPVDSREIVDMQSLATHELGHLLGLAHIPDTYDSSSIMNPSIMIGEGLASRSVSVGDIKRIQKIYGCAGSACDVDATARAILQSGLQYSVTGAQLEGSSTPSH
jgi:hypothetical protein